MKMFGCDEPEAPRDEISRLKKEHEYLHSAMAARLDKLTDLLGDLYVLSDQLTGSGPPTASASAGAKPSTAMTLTLLPAPQDDEQGSW
jgi:hypothetical protein